MSVSQWAKYPLGTSATCVDNCSADTRRLPRRWEQEHNPQRPSVWVTVSRPIGGVLSTGPLRGSGWVTIHLCGQPGRIGGRTTLSLFGLAPDGVCRAGRVTPAAGALLPHRFTLTCAFRPEGLRAIGGLFSVALSCGSPRLAASQHPVLRSPDLPQRGDHAAVTRSTHRH